MAVRNVTVPNIDIGRRLVRPRQGSERAALAIASLLALPLLVYALPAAMGHPVVPGDDLTQSLPLRQLVGQDLSTGHLPIFDPYLWSGTPLLAGWNAGAAYPLTWLFAVLPASAAWTVTLASSVAVAGAGCFAFLRATRLGVIASWLGAVTFAFGGGMAAQVSHIGLVTGMSWVPWALLAILRLTEPPLGHTGPAPPGSARDRRIENRAGRTAGWTAALAASVGLMVLAGEPRAIADGATVLLLYGAWRLSRLALAARAAPSDRRPRPVRTGVVALAFAGVAVGAVLGVGLGGVQLVPGLAAVATSQRAAVTSFLFSAGSLPTPWLLLMAVPDLLGGSGALGQPRFFASYNLTEVTGYVGMLPLVAAGALLGRRTRRGPLPEWTIWYVVGAAGVFLALGTHTPLWHVLIRIPLFGGQRLQSRSILVTGLALAVLLAFWADGWIGAAGGRGDGRGTTVARERFGGMAVPAGVIALVVVALVWRAPLLEWMGVPGAVASRTQAMGPWLVPSAVLAGAAIVVVWAGSHTPSKRRSGGRRRTGLRSAVLVGFVMADLAVFAVTTVVAVGMGAPGAPAATAGRKDTPAGAAAAGATTRARPIATLHLQGRFAVYDPALRYPGQLAVLGVPDANVVAGTSSIGGYGSIVDGTYAGATGTHGVSGTGQDVFAPHAAANGVLDALDTTTVLVPGNYLVTTQGATAPGGGAHAGAGMDARTATPGRPATWELGTPLPLTGVTVATPAVTGAPVATATAGTATAGTATAGTATVGTATVPSGRPRIGLARADGALTWARPGSLVRDAGGWHAAWPAPVQAVAVVVEVPGRGPVPPPLLTTPAGTQLRPSGALDAVLVPPHWTYAGHDGAFALFHNHRARPPLRLLPLPGGSLEGASVARTAGPALDPSAASVSSPHGVLVVRSVAAAPGWSATWTAAGAGGSFHPVHGRDLPLDVGRAGVVQVVRVPPGRGTLSWRYDAPGLLEGEVVSGVALAGVVSMTAVAAVGAMVSVRRRRSGLAAGAP